MRYHKLSLTEAPHLVGTGNHEMDREEVEWYEPPDRWLCLVLWHSGILLANGVAHPFRPGAIFVIPPRTRCRIERTGQEDLLQFWAHFVPWETKRGEVALPFQSTLGDRLRSAKREILAAMDMFAYNPAATRSFAWQLLWSIAEEPSKVTTNLLVQNAEQIVEERLGETLRVADIARELLVSHNHLTRQFVRELQVTPSEYIRNLRLNMAVRLLITTAMPIKQIAVRVGVPELSQFNRLVQDRLGQSPRAVRAERQAQDLNRYLLSDEYKRWKEKQEGQEDLT